MQKDKFCIIDLIIDYFSHNCFKIRINYLSLHVFKVQFRFFFFFPFVYVCAVLDYTINNYFVPYIESTS